jgi:glycerol-3-phosphate O-acyltransferase/dihydroxyacetone phosphate acyltransferase
MFYRLLKILSQLTIYGYFKKVKIVGREHIPSKGPYIFIANHPSAFMDPMVVATSIQPAVYFIAAGEYVGKGIKGWFFRKFLHMIPVYRPSTRPEDVHKNKDMFVKCFEHLSKKGALLIFPEGLSLTEKKLQPLKTGTVRIALGAEMLENFKLGVAIIPVGLNYSDPHSFRSDLFVKIGAPIYVRDFIDQGKIKDKEAEIEYTKEVTELLQKELQANILHLDSDAEELMLGKLEKVFARDIKADLDITFQDQESEFEMQKDFIQAIQYFKEENESLYRNAEAKIDDYLSELKSNRLSDKSIGDFKKQYHNRRFLSFFLGLPFFIFGLINNIIPYKAVGFLTNKTNVKSTFVGSMALAIGLFTFLLWYIGVAVLVGYLGLGWLAVFYPILMYTSGVYALIYVTAIQHSKKRKHLRSLTKSNRTIINELIQKRIVIMDILKKCQFDFIAHRDAVNL